MTRPPFTAVLLAAVLGLAAGPARAQDPDLIGDLLKSRPAPSVDAEEEEADGGDLDLPEVTTPQPSVEAPAPTGPRRTVVPRNRKRQ